MGTVVAVTLVLGGVALFGLMLFGFWNVRAELRKLRVGVDVLAVSVGESTVSQRREMAAIARERPTAAAPAPSSATAPVVRAGVRKVAERLDASHDAARQGVVPSAPAPASPSSSPDIIITGEASEDEHKTIEIPPPPSMTVRPAASAAPPAALEEEEPEELTRVVDMPKAFAPPPVQKTSPPPVLRCGYRYVGTSGTRAPRPRSEPPIAVLRGQPALELELEDHHAEQQVQALARGAGVRIGDDERTPPSGIPVIGKLPTPAELLRTSGEISARRPEVAGYPKIEVPPPHRGQ